ncbi:ABC transporter substrate-binding protein [Deinococcus cellulosilyticus]|uniref:ABC transporter periplasmic component n=1 Tax=Deinococcus cellulosilyticus (strain DSM 18568 / NBRC 106333 / KACC 11606 / 5516J-15) TaxID=1223518 RepID=A0A511MX24_DEIC1|nr:iron-siderophore ABC transporter substrate-binding protein [Deinococcus cellulosilyticus]GEM44686.1 ABC transporter periplasmic component [Deinococcus cellulosilyticus NBRC 106333 = KACC 11606]
MKYPLILTLSLFATAQAQNCSGRLIQHAMGETCVPKEIKRLVVLDTGELDSALALGVKPVGAVQAVGGFPAYLKDRTEGITPVGTIAEPNLEKILALKPDLILSSKLRHGNIYNQLSKIAPTVMAEAVGVVWKDNLKLNAQALNKTKAYQLLMNNYNNRILKIQGQLKKARVNTTISMIRFVPGQTRIMLQDNFIGTILRDVKLPRPKSQNKAGFMDVATPESIPLMDGSYIFYSAYGPSEATPMKDYLQSPLWKNLSAVKNGRAKEVNDDYWYLGIGMLAANKVLDDLQRIFAQ